MVAAVLVAGSEKAAAHRLGLAHSTVKRHLANARSKVGATTTAQLVWILASRLPQPEGIAQSDVGALASTAGAAQLRWAGPRLARRLSAAHELSAAVPSHPSRR